MAFFINPQDEEQKLQQNQNNSLTKEGSIVSGAPTIQKTPGDAPKNTSSGLFPNIQSYLSKNADQAVGLASNVAGKVEASDANARSNIENSGNIFKSTVDSKKLVDLDKANQDSTRIINQVANQGISSQVDNDRFGAIANATYNGPRSFEDAGLYGSLQTDVNKANTQAGLT